MREKTRVKPFMKSLILPVHEEEQDGPEEGEVYECAQYGKGKLIHSNLQDNLYYEIAEDCDGAHYHGKSVPLNVSGLEEPDETADPA